MRVKAVRHAERRPSPSDPSESLRYIVRFPPISLRTSRNGIMANNLI
jgi:hypothetical protein